MSSVDRARVYCNLRLSTPATAYMYRESPDQPPDDGGGGHRRDQVFQGVSADEVQRVRDGMVEQLSDLGYDVEHHRGGEGDAVGARSAIDRLPERDEDERKSLQQEIGPKVVRA